MIQFILGAVVGAILVEEHSNNQKQRIRDNTEEAAWLGNQNGHIRIECPHCQAASLINSYGETWGCSQCNTPIRFVVGYSDLSKAKEKNSQNVVLGLYGAFYIFGTLAVADGVVSDAELKFTAATLETITEDKEFSKVLIDAFNEGRNNPGSRRYERWAKTFVNVFGNEDRIADDFVRQLILLSFMDRKLHQNEYEIVVTVACKYLGFQKDAIDGFIQRVAAEAEKECTSCSDDIKTCFAILGCSENDSFDQVKANYRKLCMKFHPDTLSGKDLPDEFVEFANKKFQEINLAFTLLKEYFEERNAA